MLRVPIVVEQYFWADQPRGGHDQAMREIFLHTAPAQPIPVVTASCSQPPPDGGRWASKVNGDPPVATS
jgi:hypothetical protein